MKLTELAPRWVGTGGEGVKDAQGQPVPWRDRIGIIMNCPCGNADHPEMIITFKNPVDGKGPAQEKGWERTGDDFETLTLRPSIQRHGGCSWHGYITNGEVTKC